jgi:hypothetical protein
MVELIVSVLCLGCVVTSRENYNVDEFKGMFLVTFAKKSKGSQFKTIYFKNIISVLKFDMKLFYKTVYII